MQIKGQIKITGEIGYTYVGKTDIVFRGTVASDKRTYYATGYVPTDYVYDVYDAPYIITHLTGAKQ